jgi:hypothetical protein
MQPVLNPIDHEAARIGYLVEWHDRTREVAIEEQVADIVRAAAAGDLTQRVGGEHGGTLGRMREDTNRTIDESTTIAGGIQRCAEAIGGAAREIAAGNSDLSVRTEQQAASLEEAASSLEELTATVRQNADNTCAANQLVAGTGDVAARGGSVVGQVVEPMSGIDAASRRMGEIIGVIDGIAFQTKILALNVAVEAAHAGEQDRGFAVVASEVRALAQRPAARFRLAACTEVAAGGAVAEPVSPPAVGRIAPAPAPTPAAATTPRPRVVNLTRRATPPARPEPSGSRPPTPLRPRARADAGTSAAARPVPAPATDRPAPRPPRPPVPASRAGDDHHWQEF